MIQIDGDTLIKKLTDARYKILVALRPLASARAAFDITCQAMIDSLQHGDTTQGERVLTIDRIKALMFD